MIRLNYFSSVDDLCLDLIAKIRALSQQGSASIALSGGSTPNRLFELLAKPELAQSICWQALQLYWVDERMVSPEDKDSNYGMAKKLLLDRIEIPVENIHRIRGERAPEEEALRYNEEVRSLDVNSEGFPIFDLILLGVGEDGHTSSIFPHQMELLEAARAYEVAQHPLSGQYRLALTGRAILAGKEIIFLVTGYKKEQILKDLLYDEAKREAYPSYFILKNRAEAAIYTDVKV